MRNFLSWAEKKSKIVKSTNTADGFTKTFPKWPCNLMEGMELKLFLVKSLLSWTLRAFYVNESFVGKLLDLITDLILLGKWPRSSPVVRRALFACFSSFVCLITGLQRARLKLQIVSTVSFFKGSRQGLKESPNKLLTVKCCSKVSSVKSSAQTRKCFEGVKHSFFISITWALLFKSFVSWVSLKVQALGFWWFFSGIHYELETKTVLIFPHFLSSPTVTS